MKRPIRQFAAAHHLRDRRGRSPAVTPLADSQALAELDALHGNNLSAQPPKKLAERTFERFADARYECLARI